MDRDEDWRPTAPFENLKARARLLSGLRAFFNAAEVLEVETPMMSAGATVDRHIDSFEVRGDGGAWLQTSPEFAMKRLLAAGSGPIYQITRAFRQEEQGRLHNREFTLLEWYRPRWNYRQLMDELQQLLQAVGAPEGTYERVCFRDAFVQTGQPDPFRAPIADLVSAVLDKGGTAPDSLPRTDEARDEWVCLLLDSAVLPAMPKGAPWFLMDFPASQAALARVRDGDPPVAERFELIWDGLEIANGFHELTDADEQSQRFTEDRAWRRQHSRAVPPVDQRLIEAMRHGLPASSGVALGVDRLLMKLIGAEHINEVLAFPADRA